MNQTQATITALSPLPLSPDDTNCMSTHMWKVTKSTLSELQELERLHFLSIYFSIPELLMLR